MIIVIILSIVTGVGFAYYIVATWVCASNNYGDSMGEVSDFSRGTWDLVEQRNYRPKKREWTGDKLLYETEVRALRGNNL